MIPSPPASGSPLASRIGLTERVFAGPRMRRLFTAVEDGLAQVEARLATELRVTDALADATSRYLYEAGGKRVRPMLTILTAQLGQGVTPHVVAGASALEMTHLGSLYHDDVMDASDVRRGVPSAHVVWGNNVAILAGDLLFSRASQLMAQIGERAIRLQADTFERLVLGQLHETVGPAAQDEPLAHYLSVLSDKTASLIATSARYGAMFAGVAPEHVETVARYGEKVGVAFQLADDVIDLAPDGQTGKTPGTDLRERVPTMPVLLLRARAGAPDASEGDVALVALLDSDLSDDAALETAVAALRAHVVVDETRERAAALALEAIEEIATLPDGPVKDSLAAFATALVDRAR